MKAAVGHIGVTAQHEVDIGRGGSRRVLLGELALLHVRDDRALRVAVDHQMVVAVLGHRRLQIGDPGLHRLIHGEVEQPREFPPRLIRPRCATRPPDPGSPETPSTEEAQEPGDGPQFLGRRHRDGLDVLARMSRRDELVHDDLDVGVVPRRDGGPAHDQGGRVGRRSHGRRHRRYRRRRPWPITTRTATPIDTVIRVAARRTFPIPSATASAPIRPMCFALPIIVPPRMSGRNDGHRGRSNSAKGIVAPARRDELSSALLQSRSFSARYYLVAALSAHGAKAGALVTKPPSRLSGSLPRQSDSPWLRGAY